MRESWSKKSYIILLFLLIAFQIINNYIWLSKDVYPEAIDTIHNLNNQMKFYNELTSISSNIRLKVVMDFLSLFSTADPRNNTMHFIPSIASIIFGSSFFLTRMTNLIYYIILIIAVYFIGREIADKKTGLLAAFIASFYPAICGMSRQYEYDFPATAMVALCICLLLYTREFKSKKYSLFLGIALGLGILFRGQTLFFVIGPISYILYKTFLKNKQYEFSHFFNLILSISLAILISSIWWRGQVVMLARNFWCHVKVFYVPYTATPSHFYDPVIQAWGYIPYKFPSVNWFFFYLFNLISDISCFFFLIFIIGLFTFVKSKKIKEKPVIILWIVIPYIIFTIISLKFGHYYFPSFPAIALVSAAGILSLRWRIIKISLVILILVFGITQFFILSYFSKSPNYLSIKLPTLRFYWCRPPAVDNNLNQVIFNFAKIMKEKASENQDIRVGIIALCRSHVEYFLRLCLPKVQVFNEVQIFRTLHEEILPPRLNFLIVSSKPHSDSPDYEQARQSYEERSVGEKMGLSSKGLAKMEKIIKETIASIDDMIEEFKNYEILEKALLLPERQYIFLLKLTKR